MITIGAFAQINDMQVKMQIFTFCCKMSESYFSCAFIANHSKSLNNKDISDHYLSIKHNKKLIKCSNVI